MGIAKMLGRGFRDGIFKELTHVLDDRLFYGLCDGLYFGLRGGLYDGLYVAVLARLPAGLNAGLNDTLLTKLESQS